MRTPLRIALVAFGYVGAFLVATAAVAIRVARTSGPDAQAASGMYAFGDAFLFLAVFGVAALLPSGAALVLLRPHRRVWPVLAALGVGVAVTGVAAAVLFAIGRDAATASPLGMWAAISVLRILVAPLLALGFLLCAVVSPLRVTRLAFLAVVVTEAVVSVYGGVTWLVPLLFSGP